MATLCGSTAKIFAADSRYSIEQKPYSAFSGSVRLADDNFMWQHCSKTKGSSFSISLSHPSSSPAALVTHCLPFSESEERGRAETTEIGKSVTVKFQLRKECQFGDHILMVGDDPILGSWDPLNAIPFKWSEAHLWTLILEMPIEKTVQYKFLQKTPSGEISWQPGPDRVFRSWETENVVVVREEWDDAKAQKIIEEKQIDDGNEKLKEKTLVDPSVVGPPPVDDNVRASTLEEIALAEEKRERIEDGAQRISNSRLSGTVGKEASRKDNPSSSVAKDRRTADRSIQKKPPTRKSNKTALSVEDEGSLVVYDEGPVLVPGLTILASSSEKNGLL